MGKKFINPHLKLRRVYQYVYYIRRIKNRGFHFHGEIDSTQRPSNAT